MAFEATTPEDGRLRRWRRRPRRGSSRRGRRAGRRQRLRERRFELRQRRRTPKAAPARFVRNERLLSCCPFSSH
ncbi:unnamed protein product, partial [Vitis vinifera]|uniref:Uncharacterized protein n=1 Tax=Vitis vinifera TaxID=29760 RepID=D7TY42_VITVI